MHILTFGEIMLRLKPLGTERFLQFPYFEATFGGAEANAAASLANYGMDVDFLTILPDNEIGDACVRELRKFNIGTGRIVRSKNGRMGVYYLEQGANQRTGKVIYDREGSSIAIAPRNAIDWNTGFEGVDWFHISGITPAISETAMLLSVDSVKEAKKRNVTVSCDLNYRKNLWKYGKEASEVMREIVKYTDIVIANEEDLKKSLEISADDGMTSDTSEWERYRNLSNQILEAYPNLKMAAITFGKKYSADRSEWKACLNDRKRFFRSKEYEIHDIVDRVGAGDSFAGGLIYGLNVYKDFESALEFAAAASCLKFSVSGDFNRVTADEVEKLMLGDGEVVQR